MNINQLTASGRHLVSYAMGVATALGIQTIHGASVQDIGTNVDHIINGLEEVWAGLGPLVTLAMGAWAAYTARPASQVANAGAIPGVQVLVSPAAPPEVKAVAADPTTPGVKPVV